MAVADESEAHAGLEGADDDELEEFEEAEDEGDALPHAEAQASQAVFAAPALDPAAELAAQALRMSGIEPAHAAIPNAAALNDGFLRATQRAARAAETGNAAASAEEAPGADAPTDAPSETADEYARLDAREAELLAEADGHPPAEAEAAPQPAAASGAAPSAAPTGPPVKAPPPHLRGTTAGEESCSPRSPMTIQSLRLPLPQLSCEEPMFDCLSTCKRLMRARSQGGFCSSSWMRRSKFVPLNCGKSLSDVYGGSFRGFKGALHAKSALIRSRASGGGEDRVVLFVGSHNLTKASRANREFVTELRLAASDTRVAT